MRVHFKVKFIGPHHHPPRPPLPIPRAFFPKSKSCRAFSEFISKTILERVANGSLSVWGKVGEMSPPLLVMPITIEPTKSPMCHDERFLNLWIKDLPLSLDLITELSRYVLNNSFRTSCEDKSGYDYVRLSSNSRTYFGLQWNGWYFVFYTLPFGWKASAYLYHSIGLIATSYIRSHGIPCSQYIDDRYLVNFKSGEPLLLVLGLVFSVLKQPFISPATSSLILATLLALKSRPFSPRKR